ncbi:MAG: class I SAM-dependent methyltransferase [Anaerolineae bacterium]|nr:class I SAM-dependent methyltransferase [Anaerolineae bacterium]
MGIFFEIHKDLPREGPGSHASMLKALSLLKELPAHSSILDVGCGPGKQTIALAKETGGAIVAVDTHQPFLDGLERRAREAGVADQITVTNMSMDALAFPEESFDLIWSEGAIYIMGFAEGLRTWRPMVKIDGHIAVTEITWLKSEPPDECKRYWDTEYPAMRTATENLHIVRGAGYELIDYFTLPDADWWDDYYTPMEERIALLREQYADDPEAIRLLDASQMETDIHRKYSAWYGYVFYLARRAGA